MKNIKIYREIEVDNSLAKGIKWLNQNGFVTLNSCSGMREEHEKNERDSLFVDFYIDSNLKNEIKLICRDIDFKFKENNGILRIECNLENKVDLFYDLIEKLKAGSYRLMLRTMGISNSAYCEEEKKSYSVQFYDYDIPPGKTKEERIKDVRKILRIFPYDCVCYRTQHGIHFISFSILHGLKITKARAIETSKLLGSQDYWTTAKDLTLRVMGKYLPGGNRMIKRKLVSPKPKFNQVLKKPIKPDLIISEKHLDFYYYNMGLPQEIYELYEECERRDLKIKLYHYKTRI